MGFFRWCKAGIIPARAGSTHHRPARRPTHADHPRSRGEHTLFVDIVDKSGGSSPLARGALGTALKVGGAAGIIPARAGSTRVGNSRWSHSGDHPRSRGEHVFAQRQADDFAGSSPLARGAHSFHPTGLRCAGIIPARAGSTPSPSLR